MGKYQYAIVINDGEGTGDPYRYDYGSTKNIRLWIQKQKAVILFEQGVKKDLDDMITFKSKLFRDALRKVYLVHALKYNQGLIVKEIRMDLAGTKQTYTEKDPHFPFLFSMIQKRDQKLNSAWKEMIPAVIQIPKSVQDVDHRFCALFAFLAAKNRRYEVDAFSNFWTAMNGYENAIAKCYEDTLKEKYEIEKLSKNKKGKLSLLKKDVQLIRVMSLLLDGDVSLISANEMSEKWENYYGIQGALKKISGEDYPALYEESFANMTEHTKMSERFAEAQACADFFEMPLFLFLLFWYPYHLRCELFHGSFSTILFSAYNDYELYSLKAVNYFLERFLNEKIPELFAKDAWTDEKYQAVVACMCKSSGKEYHDVYNELTTKYQK